MLVLAMEFSRDRNGPAARAGPDRTEVAENGVASRAAGAAPPDNGTEVGPTPPPTTERPKPAISGVREGLRRVIDSEVSPSPPELGE